MVSKPERHLPRLCLSTERIVTNQNSTWHVILLRSEPERSLLVSWMAVDSRARCQE